MPTEPSRCTLEVKSSDIEALANFLYELYKEHKNKDIQEAETEQDE